MPTSTQEQYEFAEVFRKNGFSCRGDVDIAPYEPPGRFSKFRRVKQKTDAAFAAPVFLFAEQSPLLAETADLRIYDLSVFNVNRAAEVLGVAAACQRIGIF